ncbi:MAG: hypothetical protein HY820_19060 [Acidobacteria bacterium]|nr:hypothetical protein [Acidobacteriota bacterium]
MRLLCTWLMSAVLLLGHCVDCFKTKQSAQHSCCHKKESERKDTDKPACPVDQVLVQEAKDSAATSPVIAQFEATPVVWHPVALAGHATVIAPLAGDLSIFNHVLRI